MPLLSAPAPASATIPMHSYGRRHFVTRLLLAVEWALLFAASLYMGGRALPRAWLHLNTDFPNYYVTARLLREGYSTNRIYEWIWLQRQKDRMGIRPSDQPVVGFVPHPPFSALLMWPLTYWPPLAAKRIWIVFNLLLLVAVAVLLRSLTHLAWRQLALLIGFSYPLLRNFEYGQYYLLLLFLITSALSLYLANRRFAAGALLGVACGLKVFPGFFLLYFARKRDPVAAAGLIAGALTTVVASVSAFGFEIHRTYLNQVLPWALRGDAMDPYSLGLPSLSSLLHKLLLFEPEWNAHPLVHAPVAFAILLPLLQLIVLAPAIYLAIPKDWTSQQLKLEWSTLLVALLAISTLPASYHFTLLILPTAILASSFLRQKAYGRLTLLAMLYLAIGFPRWPNVVPNGGWALLAVPRLYCVLLLCGLCYVTLLRQAPDGRERPTDRVPWAAALAAVLLFQIASSLNYQRRIHNDERSRILTSPDILLATEPIAFGDGVEFIAMRSNGYVAGSTGTPGTQLKTDGGDQLSQTTSGGTLWTEEAGTSSQIVKTKRNPEVRQIEVSNAEFPVASPDGRWLAYLRSNQGKAAVWLRKLTTPRESDVQVTPSQFDVEEMTFLADGSLIVAAAQNGHPSSLYLADLRSGIQDLHISNARYPAASSDGSWLAFSQLDRGVWNLWLKDLRTGSVRSITNGACNNISPAWFSDSKTLVYASDCERALWFTSLHRLKVVP
jgi:hypothetical protein